MDESIEQIRAQLKTVTHERDVARRAMEIVYAMADSFGCKGLSCPEWKLYIADNEECDCGRAALAMAEKELAK